MNKIRMIFFVSLSFISFFSSQIISAAMCSNLHASLIGGYGFTSVGDGKNVWLANSPEPGLENHFTTNTNQSGAFLLGLALEKMLFLNNLEGDIGVEIDYLRNPSLKGIVHPMVNVAPDFDILDYSYDMKVYMLFATAKLSKPNIWSCIGAYLQGGLGRAINKLSDYTETSPKQSSAAPMLAPFGDNTNLNLAYFLGVGITFNINNSTQFLIGYRYINSGSTGFKRSPRQQTNNTLNFARSQHHFLILSLVI